jgi:hypothetical protein
MVITLLADVTIEGHIDRLVARMRSGTWREFWDHLDLRYSSFLEAGLSSTDPDSVVWRRCQELDFLLLTDNRNDDGPESLEATIQHNNTAENLPVFTIGDSYRLLTSTEYADRVIDRLLSYLLEFEQIRGTGRLFLP